MHGRPSYVYANNSRARKSNRTSDIFRSFSVNVRMLSTLSGHCVSSKEVFMAGKEKWRKQWKWRKWRKQWKCSQKAFATYCLTPPTCPHTTQSHLMVITVNSLCEGDVYAIDQKNTLYCSKMYCGVYTYCQHKHVTANCI